jgi:hypothetical protein
MFTAFIYHLQVKTLQMMNIQGSQPKLAQSQELQAYSSPAAALEN